MVSPFIFLLSFLARSIPLAELRQHSAQARESLSSVAVGAMADGDCTFQDTKSLLNHLVEGVQIPWCLGVKEFGQCLEVGFNFSALGLGKASFFVEGSHYSGGHKFEGVKFLPELSRLLVASSDSDFIRTSPCKDLIVRKNCPSFSRDRAAAPPGKAKK